MHYDISKNRLVSRDTAQGQTAQYSYDANGNLLEADGRQYEWTAFNKVSQITDNGNKVGYQYDASRNRVKKTNNGRTTYYFGRDYELVIEAGETGSIRRMRHHIFVGDELVATHEKTLINNQKQVDQTSYMHRDALGSIDTVTDQNQQVIQSNRYTPFGEDIEENGLAKSTRYLSDELRGYTSHENVGLTGLINMNARLYDPLIGRFIQADTMIPEPDSSQSYNRYAYVINNPT